MDIEYSDGIHLPDIDMWLDAESPKHVSIVSHAHSDHTQPHTKVICTPATAELMKLRMRSNSEYRYVNFLEPFEHNGAVITLYPAGHMLGSAQVLVENDGIRLLYSGDFKLSKGLASEEIVVPRADVVIMETTFGKSKYSFGSTRAVREQMLSFCENALENGKTPILFGYAIGKAQEALAMFNDSDINVAIHPLLVAAVKIYQRYGISFPHFSYFEPGGDSKGKVIIMPPHLKHSADVWNVANHTTAFLSGWGVDAYSKYRYGVEQVIPLSDHADYKDLHEYVKLTGARRIYTTHGFCREFSRDLKGRGYSSHPLDTLCPLHKYHYRKVRSQLSLFGKV